MAWTSTKTMYQDYFRLHRNPFSIAPDPSFLYLSSKHREALAHLMYGLQSDGGFVVLTGEVGTGKTTLLRTVLEQIPDHVDVAFILNPKLTVKELLETLCDELGIPYQRDDAFSIKEYIDRLNKQLLKTHSLGRSTVVIIDEAQNLSPTVLEQIRLLTNLETNERKLLRIILLGQPELNELLRRKELRQLAQRVTARYHLEPLDVKDTQTYIAHRLTQAGGGAHLFSTSATKLVFHLSSGIPRLINILSDRSLLGTYVEGKPRVTPSVVRKAAKEIQGPLPRNNSRYTVLLITATVILLLAFAYSQYDSWPEAASPELTQAKKTQAPDVPLITPTGSNTNPLPVIDRSNAPVLVEHPIEITAPAHSNSIALPQDLTPYESQRMAFSSAFKLWHVPYDDGQIPCNYAPLVGLQCLRRHAGWQTLLLLNRPAIIELSDEDSPLYFGTITALEEDRITLVIGTEELLVSRDTLSRFWAGNFIVLWQMPPSYKGSIREGDQGSTVLWLRQQLAAINKTEDTAGFTDQFDAEFSAQVIAYQESRGLLTDGVVGPVTLVQINSDTTNDLPRLRP